jgi:hypothetical protein
MEEVAKNNWVAITKDRKILVKDVEYEVLRELKVKTIFLGPYFDLRTTTRMDMAVAIFKVWHKLIEVANKMEPGDIYVMGNGSLRKIDPESYRARLKAKQSANLKANQDKPQGLGNEGRKPKNRPKPSSPPSDGDQGRLSLL